MSLGPHFTLSPAPYLTLRLITLPPTTLQAVQGRRFGAAALRCVARVAKAAPHWGVIFFGYDWFAAYSAAAAANVAWDILIPHYKAPLPSRICFALPAMNGSLSNDVAVLAHASKDYMQKPSAAARHSFLPKSSPALPIGYCSSRHCGSMRNMTPQRAPRTPRGAWLTMHAQSESRIHEQLGLPA